MAIPKNPIPFEFPYLETERLVLTTLSQDDFAAVKVLHTDERLLEYVPRKKANSDQEITAYIDKITKGVEDRKWASWKIQQKGNTQLIGTICLWMFTDDFTSCDIGYELLPAHWGNGYIAETSQPVLQFGFDVLGLERIQGYVHKENIRSINVLEKAGYRLVNQKDNELIYEIRKEVFLAAVND